MNNWNNLSDDELDKLFRQTADENNIEFEEGAWNKMESLLDEKKPFFSNSFWKKNALVLVAILFLTGSGLYFGKNYFLNNSSENISKNNVKIEEKENLKINNQGTFKGTPNQINEKEITIENNKLNNKIVENNTNSAETNSGNKLGIITNEENIKSNKSSGPVIESKATPEKSIVNSTESKKEKAKNLAKTNANSNYKDKNSTLYKPENNGIGISKKQNIEKENDLEKTTKTDIIKSKKLLKSNTNASLISQENFSINTNSANNIDEGKLENLSKVKDKNTISKNKSGNEIDNFVSKNLTGNDLGKLTSVSVTDAIIESDKTEIQLLNLKSLNSKQYKYKKPQFSVEVVSLNLPLPNTKAEPFFKKGLSVRVGISPDISTIGSNSIHKIGSNMGGFLEYRFSNRVVLQAGVFRSMKYYDAYPEQYDWVWGPPPTKLLEIAAQCKMLDFPINLRYDFISNPKSRLFGGMGITSYQMKNETYDYDYEDNSNPNIKWRKWSKKTDKYYFNSNLNFSVGFEKQISKKLTIQIEPFAKAPLKSIGFGKVPLISYGMMFSANYPLRNLFK